jgi:hypothetical protein
MLETKASRFVGFRKFFFDMRRRIQKLKDDLKKFKDIADSKVYPQRLRGSVEHEVDEVLYRWPLIRRFGGKCFCRFAQSDEEGQSKRTDAADAEAQVWNAPLRS